MAEVTFIQILHLLNSSNIAANNRLTEITQNVRHPAGKYMFKVNCRRTRTRCEICSKLTIKTLERPQWRCSGVFIVNFEQVNAGWEGEQKQTFLSITQLTFIRSESTTETEKAVKH